MHKKTRLSVLVLTTIFLFSSSLSGCRSISPELVEQGAKAAREALPKAAREAEPAASQLGKVALRSEAEIAARLGIDLLTARAAQRDYPQINDQAQQIYAAMVQSSGHESLAQANDAVQQAADQQNKVIAVTTVSSIAGGVAVDYATTHQG